MALGSLPLGGAPVGDGEAPLTTLTKAGYGTAGAVARGVSTSDVAETGYGTAGAVGAGSKLKIPGYTAKTGRGAARTVGAGASASLFSKRGYGTAAATAAGAWGIPPPPPPTSAATLVDYPGFTLEWAPTSQPTVGGQTYEDITDRVREWGWRWGRNDELGEFEPGSGYLLLDNRDRAFDPYNPDGPWYGNVKPRRAFRLSATVGTSNYVIFVGYARGFPQQWPASGFDSVVRVELTDYMAVFATFELPVGFTRPAELSGARIEAVLDAVGAPYRAISPGTVTIEALTVETAGTTALQHMRDCARDEFGQFFDRNGVMVFHDRAVRLGLGSTFFPLYDYADARGVLASARYDNRFELEYDDTYLLNKARVDAADPQLGAAGLAEDTASRADYWTVTKTIPSHLADPYDRQALAEYHVLRYKQPEYRVPRLEFQLGGQDTEQEQKHILAATVSDPITVTRYADPDDPIGGDPVVLNQVVEGGEHSYRPGGTWVVSLATSPGDTRTYWTLEDPVYGALDNSNILISP